jgi:putative hemolysin
MLDPTSFFQSIPLVNLQIILLIVLLGLSGFFSSYETAITALSRLKIRQMIKDHKPHADIVEKLRENINDTIITILIGNNLVNIGASVLATLIATEMFGSSSVGMVIGVLTFLVLIFGEITPKAYATQNAEKHATKFAPLFYFLSRILKPVIWILTKITNVLIHMMGGKIGDDPLVTHESIRAIAEIGHEEGILAESQKDLIHKVITFNSTTADKIMTPRVNMLAINIADKITKIKKTIVETHYSRLPVYEKDHDHIIGVLMVSEFLKRYKPNLDIRTLIKPAYFVTGEKRIDILLEEMQAKHIHLAIVVDAAGGVAGIVTLEDIMEELVGEIYDETDINRHLIKHIDKRTFDVDADINIKNIDSRLKISLPDSKVTSFSSINEFILNKLGHIPKSGEEIVLDDVVIQIIKANKHKIQVVRIRKK